MKVVDLPTEVELTVDFLAVDYVEAIRNTSFHVAHFEIEPLMMVVGVDICTQNQVVLKLTYLKQSHTNKLFYDHISKSYSCPWGLFKALENDTANTTDQ